MRQTLFLILFFCLLQPLLIAQEGIVIPQTKDSLESFILNRRSRGLTDRTYYFALKDLSRLLMYENRKLAINYLNEAMSIAEIFKDTVEIASIHHMMGLTYRHWGFTYAAAEYFQQSYILSEKIGKKNVAGYDLLSIGNVYYDLKKWQEAEMYYRRAARSFSKKEEIGGKAVALNNIALTFLETGKTDSSIYYFNSALTNRRKQGDSILVAQSFWYLSTVYLQTKNYKEGLYFGRTALGYFSKYGNKNKNLDLNHLPLAIQYHLGCLHNAVGQKDSALYYWNKSVELGKENPNLTSYSFAAYREIARHKSEENNLNEAIKLLKEAISFAAETHFNEEMEKLYLQIADLLEKSGNYSESARYLREYQVLLKNKAIGASNQMLNFHVLFETYEQKAALRDKEVQLEKEKLKRRQQLQLNLMYLSGLGISVLGLIIVLYLYRSIIKINNTLEQRNKAIEDKNKIIESNAKELEELNETKDLLFSVIAHDLRSPFNALTNFSKLMQNYISNNQWQELKNSFRVLEESSQNAYWTFENLLGWVQGQTGKLEAKISSVDIMPLLDEALGLSSSMLLLKNMKINKKVAARYVMADPYMLETVLRNLITNAIKFSSEEGCINIETYYEDDMMKIVISDEGIGMSPDALKNLFNPEKLKINGQSITGLGMLICRQFIDSMQGSIIALSIYDKGTSFEIYLPKAEMTVPFTADDKKTDYTQIPNDQRLSPETKILLSKYIQELRNLSVYEASEVKELLRNMGAEKTTAKDFEHWLSKLNQALYLSDSITFEKLLQEIEEDV
jgi:signal transduction histidine kinase